MRVKLKAVAVGHGGIEQAIDLTLDVVDLEERAGKVCGSVGTEHGDIVASFEFAPEPGFNAWGSPDAKPQPLYPKCVHCGVLIKALSERCSNGSYCRGPEPPPEQRSTGGSE